MAVVLGGVSVAATLGKVIVKFDPERAYLLAPGDGNISAALAERKLLLELEPARGSPAARLAVKALQTEPMAVKALSVLALQAELRSEPQSAARYFSYATKLSKRELRPRIWLIEKAVAAGDIAGALRHYDIALKTSFAAQTILYPVLASALREPRIRAELIELLGTRPSWGPTFGSYLAVSGTDPMSAVLFLNAGAAASVPVSPEQRAVLQDTLIAQNRADLAWEYYRKTARGAERSELRDPDFVQGSRDPGPFDWRLPDAEGISAAILNSGGDGSLEFSVSRGRAGEILRQTTLLPPGRYRLRSAAAALTGVVAESLRWELRCAPGGRTQPIPITPGADGHGRANGSVIIPAAGCEVQSLSLVARGGYAASDMQGRIENVRLEKAS